MTSLREYPTNGDVTGDSDKIQRKWSVKTFVEMSQHAFKFLKNQQKLSETLLNLYRKKITNMNWKILCFAHTHTHTLFLSLNSLVALLLKPFHIPGMWVLKNAGKLEVIIRNNWQSQGKGKFPDDKKMRKLGNLCI